jgi:hypothetical protein
MTDTLLQVLTYRHEALTVRSTSNPVQLKQPDGNAELVVPSLFDHWTFRQWVEVQTIENTLLRLEEKPLHLDVLIDVPKDEAEPSQLWWYPGLPPAARGGRPVGSNRFQSEDAVLRWLKPYVHAIWRDSRYPSLSAVAGQIGVHEDTIRHHIERFFPDWESVLKLLRGNFR